MSVKVKIGVILLVLLSLFSFINFGVQIGLIHPQLVKIEQEQANANILRVKRAFERELNDLEKFSKDWGSKGGAYFFIKDTNATFLESNLGITTYKNNDLTHIALLNYEGGVLFSKSVDLESSKEYQLNSLNEKINQLVNKISNMPMKKTVKGYFLTERTPIFVVVTPVFKTDDRGHSSGVIVMARPINDNLLLKISAETGVLFEININKTNKSDEIIFVEKTLEKYHLRQELEGLFGVNSIQINMMHLRRIAQEGMASLETIVWVNITSFLVLFLMVQFLISRMIIKPVSAMIQTAKKMRSNLNIELDEDSKNDEVSEMVSELNFMIEHIQVQNHGLIKSNEKLNELARIDPLTGLFNRRALDEILDKEWKRLFREKKPLSVILCDIDFFKKLNDKYGHQKGDEALIAVANTINKTILRSADVATRYGGEEFCVVLPNTNLKGAKAVAETIRKEVEKLSFHDKSHPALIHLTISLGVACTIPRQGVVSFDLVKAADDALYKAKQGGRNKVVSTPKLK